MENQMTTIITKLKNLKFTQLLLGFFVGIITFLSGLLFLSEKKRKVAQSKVGEKTLENIELKAKNEVSVNSLSDIIARDNEDIRRRDGK